MPTKQGFTKETAVEIYCKKCENSKSADQFAVDRRNAKTGRQRWCRDCMAAYNEGRLAEIAQLVLRYSVKLPREHKNAFTALAQRSGFRSPSEMFTSWIMHRFTQEAAGVGVHGLSGPRGDGLSGQPSAPPPAPPPVAPQPAPVPPGATVYKEPPPPAAEDGRPPELRLQAMSFAEIRKAAQAAKGVV